MTAGELWLLMGVKVDDGTVKKAERVLDGLRSRAKALLSIRGVESVMGLVEKVTESATHLVSYSHAMGMTIEQTQEWGYVAEQSGSNLKELSTGMNMFIRNVNEFRKGRGGKALHDTFRNLGIDQGAAKNIMSGSQGLNDELLKMSDRIKKTGGDSKTLEATFTRAFGVKAGRAMLADLARGSEGIKELMERRRAMGELNEKEAMTLRDLGNHMKDVKTQFFAIASTVIAKLAPTLLRLVDGTLAWIAANKELISGVIGAALDVVVELFKTLGDVVTWVQGVIQDAFDGDTGAQAILIGLAAAILSIVVPSLLAMARAAWMSLGPYAIIAAGVALIAYGLLQLVKYWDDISAAVGSAWTTIKNKVGSVIDWISKKWDELGDEINNLPETIYATLIRAFDYVSNKIGEALDWIAKKAHEVWEDMKDIPILGYIFKAGEKVADFVSGDTGSTSVPTTSVPTTNVSNTAAGSGGVSIGPTTVNINGVKDAVGAINAISDNIDQRTRNAAAALNPGGR